MKFASILLASLLILISPWMIGGNYLYFQTVLLVVAAIFGLMAAMTCLVERKAFSTSLLWLVLPAGIAYTIYQTLPISGPISIYPSASRAEIYVLASAITLFLSSVVLFRDQKTIVPVIFSIGAVGFAVAFVGVVQNLGFNGKVLWVYDLLYGGQPFGPFVNKNNGAGFLILTLAGPMYFLTRQLLRAMKKSNLSSSAGEDLILPDSSKKRRRKTKTKPLHLLLSGLANLEAKHLYGITGLVVIVVGVFLSFSRGGSISVVFALTVGIVMLMTANRWAIMLAGIVIVVGVGAVVWTEQAAAVQEKLATITDAEGSTEARLLHWQDAMPYYEAHALFGSGLGTYRYEYPKFQQHRFPKKFGHAENVYLETLAELGIFGVIALVITLLTIFYCSIKLFRQKSSSDRALGVGATTAMVGLTAASCLDFGIYQPANFIVAAILFGAVVGRAGSPDLRKQRDKSGFPAHYLRFAILLVLVLGLAYATFPSSAVESAKYARRQLALHVQDNGASPFRIEKAKSALEFSERFLDRDWEVQYLLGQCEIFAHRQNLTNEVQEETEAAMLVEGLEAGMTEEEIEEQFPSRADFWSTTSMMNMHRIMRLTQARNYEEYLSSRQDPEVVTPELQNAWKYFNEAVACCDRSERVHYRLAQLSVILGDEKDNLAEETMHVDNALEMAKGYSGLLFDAGLLAMHSGQYERAAELWSDCISRTRRYESRIVQFGLGLPAKMYFEKVLPQNPQDLLRISRRYFSSDDQQVPNELLLVHTRRLINNSELDDVKKWELTGQAWFRAKDYEKAIIEYERVLSTKPNRPPWRLDYANCLANAGRYDDAIREMKICQLEQPDDAIRIGRLVQRTKRERIKDRKSQREEE